MEWKDITSYSKRVRKEDRVPRVFELDLKGLRIVIHRRIHEEGWFLSCHGLNISDFFINTENADEAKKKGLEIIILRISALENIKDLLESLIC